jgi:shikimate kinase
MKERIVLATGGGAILDEINRRALKSHGTVFYLSSDLKSLLERTHKDKNRPLLHGEEPADVILTRLIEQRDPLYRETADYIVDTSNDSLRHVIHVIISHLDATK